MKLSIIVPMRNEATQLGELLPTLQHLQRQGHEVILVDGGSTDGCDHLAACAGLTVLHALRGRA
ncbi:MAG: glycosyl transferase, partial [Comamonadaceae bacterium CG17_big_fil_post_rev_8_21_14_2_50_60_13]